MYDELVFEGVMPEAAGPATEWRDDAPSDARAHRSVMPGATRQKTLLGTCLRQVVEEVLMASTDRERLYVARVCCVLPALPPPLPPRLLRLPFACSLRPVVSSTVTTFRANPPHNLTRSSPVTSLTRNYPLSRYCSVERPLLTVSAVARVLKSAADVGIDVPSAVAWEFSPDSTDSAAADFLREAGIDVPLSRDERVNVNLDDIWWSLHRIKAREIFAKVRPVHCARVSEGVPPNARARARAHVVAC